MPEAERGFWSRRGIKPWLFESLAENAARVCGDSDATIFLKRNGALRHVAHYGSIPTPSKKGESGPPIDDRRSVPGRAFVDGQTVHVHDVQAADEFPLTKAKGIAHGVRTSLAMPLLHEGVPMGVILMRRTEVRPFSDKEIALVKTFVDQAAMAFEHGQLFREIDARNHDLAESLAQQTATSEILRVIASSPTDLQPVLNTVAENAARICEANDTLIYRVDGQRLRGVADYGPLPGQLGKGPTLTRLSVPSRCIIDRQTIHVHDLAAVPTDDFRANFLRSHGTRTVLATPLMRQGVPIGVILIRRMEVRPFSDRQIALLETFADQAVIAIENVRLFQELETRNRELTDSLTQQTATSEILRAITSSPTDLQPVLNTVAENAARICEANDALIYRFDGHHFTGVAEYGPLPGNLGKGPPHLDRLSVPGRAVIDRKTIHVNDLFEVPTTELRADFLRKHGTRTILATPLLREGIPIGVIMIRRMEVRPFSDRQIALLETFADQAVIAIENVRLFQEIQEKNEQLETASRYKSQFLANMSHELRTPLNGILGLTEMIQDKIYGEVPEKIRSALDDVQTSGRHLLNLINDVLDLSKIEAGRATLSLQEYSMREIVQAVFTAMQPLAAAKKLAFEIGIPPDLLPGKADQRRITQVLMNLVGNAIKFAETGKVRVDVQSADDSFLVSVSDTGPGIAPADQERIFAEFQQVDGSSSRAKGGTGLGLAIAKRIIEMHGGRIWMESKIGVGSTFTFTLPVRVECQVGAS